MNAEKREQVYDTLHFQHAHTKVARWKAEVENANHQRDLARIFERMYKLRVQSEPLNKLTQGNDEEHKRINKAIRYVVTGRVSEEA